MIIEWTTTKLNSFQDPLASLLEYYGILSLQDPNLGKHVLCKSLGKRTIKYQGESIICSAN